MINNIKEFFNNNFSDVLSLTAIVISLYTWRRTSKLENANIEYQVQEMISSRKKDTLELLKNDKLKFNACIEEELNAYDNACGFYIDKKIDKKRFKKRYSEEIKNIVESEEYKEIGRFSDIDCKFECIKRVYEIIQRRNAQCRRTGFY